MEIFVSDVSLKTSGKEVNALSFKERLDVATGLNELGVNYVEVGPVFKEKADEVLVKTLCGLLTKSVIACVVEDEKQLDKNFSLISAAKRKKLVLSFPASSVKMEYSVGKKPQAVLEQIKSLTVKAAALTEDVEVSLADATRADKTFLADCIKAAISSGAKTVTLSDEAGITYPEEYGEFIKGVYESVPELKTVKLFVACSDATSMAAANTLTAILLGAAGVKVSALKNCDLSSIESFFSAMENVLVKKGFSYSLNKTAMSRILKRVSSLSAPIEQQAQAEEECAETLTQSSLGKLIKKLGYDLSAEDMGAVYSEYKRISANKHVGVKEIEAIVASAALQVKPTYVLDRFSVQSSNVITSTASVILKKDGEEVKGVSFGNGPIDAAFMAIESIVGIKFELDDFQITSLTEGKEAVGEALVKLRYNGKIYSGRGLSTDIVGASIRAYISAVNKIVYEEK